MREVVILAVHLLVTLAKILRPGGVRAVAAEARQHRSRPAVSLPPLARKLEALRDYYNGHRVHRALAGLTPVQRATELPLWLQI